MEITWISLRILSVFLSLPWLVLPLAIPPLPLVFRHLKENDNSILMAISSNFLQPRDFIQANGLPVEEPTAEDLQAMQMPNLFEGDIRGMQTPFDRRLYDDSVFIYPQYTALNTVTYPDKVWPDGRVPYELEEHLTDDQRAAVAQAFEEYRRKTCIRFVPRQKNDPDYVYVQKNYDGGCSSYVGRAGGNQTLSLEVKKCFKKGIIAHELMHSLGFFHEHSRPDRDLFVDIVEPNIKPGMLRNFEKYPNKIINTLNMPYDYESVMHYHKLAFSRNGQPTILPRSAIVEIGQRLHLSKIDALKVNTLYNCKDYLTSNKGFEEEEIEKEEKEEKKKESEETEFGSRKIEKPGENSWTEDYEFFTTSPIPMPMPTEFISSTSTTQEPSTTTAPESTTGSVEITTTSILVSTSTRDVVTTSTTVSSKISTSTEATSTTTESPKHSANQCLDLNDHCELWADIGHCKWSEKYMSHYCRQSCRMCHSELPEPTKTASEGCLDQNLFCGYWARIGECETESKFMKLFCPKACKVCSSD